MNCSYKKVTASLTGIVLMSSLAFAGISPANAATVTPTNAVMAAAAVPVAPSERASIAELEKLINDYRATYGLKPLKFNGTAAAESLDWSKTMATKGFRHKLKSELYQPFEGLYSSRLENIAMNAKGSVEILFDQWKTSASHNAAMLSPTMESFGAGFYTSKSGETAPGTLYGTIIFHSAHATYMPDTYENTTSYFGTGNALAVNDASLLKVTPKAVTFNTSTRKFTIPNTPGVRYVQLATFKTLPAGTYDVYGRTMDIVAMPQEGYTFNSGVATSWIGKYDLGFKSPYLVSEPIAYDGANRQGFLLPANGDVDYFINGAKAIPGMNYTNIVGKVSVTAKMKPNEEDYQFLEGYYGPWVYNFGLMEVDGVPVSFDAKNRKYTVPSAEGISYKVNGTTKAPGTYTASAGETLNIVPVAKSGYAIFMEQNFAQSYTFGMAKVAAKAPAFDANDFTYTIPSTEGVTYKVNGVTKNAGVYDGAPTTKISIQASANTGYELTGTSSWTYTYGNKTVSIAPVTFNDNNYSYTIPKSEGVDYFVGSTKANAGTYSSSVGTTVSITTKAVAGYSLNGTSSWTKTFGNAAASGAPVFSFDNGTYTIPSVNIDGIDYYVNGVITTAGTYTDSTYRAMTVTVKPKPGYYITGTTSWNFDFSKKTVTASKPVYNAYDQTVFIPNASGVSYSINGTPVKAGLYPVTGSFTISVKSSSDRYIVSNTGAWEYEFATSVTPTAPTANNALNNIIIPETAGVVYKIDGSKKAAGVYPYTGTFTVTAVAENSSYSINGTSSWNFDNRDVVTTTAPKFDAIRNTVVIPSTKGIVYSINGVVKSAGTHTYPMTGTVTAKALNSDYILSGNNNWGFDNRDFVSSKAPTFNASKNTVTIPSVSGVTYYINNVAKKAGTYTGYSTTGTVTLKVTGVGVVFSGSSSWKFDNREKVSTLAPTFSEAKNTVRINARTGVNYYINGSYKKPGTYSYSGTGTVTAKVVNSGYIMSGATSWKFDNRNTVIPTKPTFSASKNQVTIPKKTGVNYYINGSYKKTGTYSYSGTGKVTTKASSGAYKLAKTQTWSFDNRNSMKPSKPTFTASKDTVKIPKVTGVNYYINGKYKKAGTYKYRGTVKVTTKASSGSYKLSGTQSWTAKL